MKNAKRFLTLCLSLLVALPLTGCHGSKGSIAFTTPDNFDDSKTYELTFWAKNDTNKVQTAIYNKAIEDFESLYPNIHVNMKLYNDYSRIYNDVITNISTSTTPNICITYPDHIATYMTGENVVVPLDDLFEDEKYGFGGSDIKFDGPAKEDIIPEFLEECKLAGRYYAVPYMRSTEALYINKTYVEKLGYEIPDILTWDYVWEVSEKAMEKDASGNFLVNNQNVMIPFIYKSTDNMMISLLKQKNAGYSDSNGNIMMFNDTTKDILFTVRDHVMTGAFSTFKISSYPGNFLNAGQCLFAVDSTAGATWMGSHAPLIDISPDKLVEFETVVRPIPQVDINNPKMISQGPSICIFNKEDSNEVLASWLFVQFMLTNDVQIAYSETEGYTPVTYKAQNDPSYLDYLSREGEDNSDYYDIKIQATKLLLNNTENTFVTPVFNGSASLREAAGQLIEEVCKYTRKKKVADDAFIEELYDTMVAKYHLDQVKAATGDGAVNRDLGPLPGTAIALIIVLVATWLMIGMAFLLKFVKKSDKE